MNYFKKLRRSGRKGQAVVEYIMLFGFLALMTISMVTRLGKFMTTSGGSMGFYLTQHLATGVCATNCFVDDYLNRAF